MKSRRVMLVTAITLFIALAIPAGLAGQERVGEEHAVAHNRYRLIDLGTFGGSTSYLAQDFNLTGSNPEVLTTGGR